MSLKAYFKGKSGFKFWLNIFLMIALVALFPTLIFFSLKYYTHHGEKIEVPDVHGMSLEYAASVLEKAGFEVEISDSVDTKAVRPGAVLEQTPKAGTEIKSGRIVYLVTRYKNEACVEIPQNFAQNSYRVGKQILQNLGLRFTPDSLVDEYDEEVVLGLYQGRKLVKAGDKVLKSKPLTYHIGSGIHHEVMESDTVVEEEEYDPNFAE